MGASTSSGDGDVVSDINVTPLVDVTLVILIVFMITFPKMAGVATVKVDLPETQSIEVENPDSLPLTLNLKREGGRLQLFREQVETDEKELRSYFSDHQLAPEKQAIALAAEQNIPYGEILDVMEMLSRIGVHKLSLNTQHTSN